MSDLLTRLRRLSGDNPVQSVKLKPEDWPDLERVFADAERLSFVLDHSPHIRLEIESGRLKELLYVHRGHQARDQIDAVRKKEAGNA